MQATTEQVLAVLGEMLVQNRLLQSELAQRTVQLKQVIRERDVLKQAARPDEPDEAPDEANE